MVQKVVTVGAVAVAAAAVVVVAVAAVEMMEPWAPGRGLLAVGRGLSAAEKVHGSFGSDVLWVFVPAALISVVVSVWLRLRTTRRKVEPSNEQLSAYEIAAMFSDERAVYTAVAFLRTQGHIDSAGRAPRWLERRERAQLHPLVQVVFRHLHDLGPTIETYADPMEEPLALLRGQLAERGYIANGSFQRKVWTAVVPMAFVGALGVLWLLVCYLTGSRMDLLGAALVLFAAPGLVAMWPVRVTPLGRATRKSVKKRFRHLRPVSSPAYSTYGSAAAVMGVAVFGRSALNRIDHGLAKAVRVRKAPTSTGGNSGGGGDGCGGCGG